MCYLVPYPKIGQYQVSYNWAVHLPYKEGIVLKLQYMEEIIMEAIYDAKLDPEFQNAFIDIDKQDSRKLPDGTEIPLRYIHGGFEGTAVRFSFFYPEKERY